MVGGNATFRHSPEVAFEEVESLIRLSGLSFLDALTNTSEARMNTGREPHYNAEVAASNLKIRTYGKKTLLHLPCTYEEFFENEKKA